MWLGGSRTSHSRSSDDSDPGLMIAGSQPIHADNPFRDAIGSQWQMQPKLPQVVRQQTLPTLREFAPARSSITVRHLAYPESYLIKSDGRQNSSMRFSDFRAADRDPRIANDSYYVVVEFKMWRAEVYQISAQLIPDDPGSVTMVNVEADRYASW